MTMLEATKASIIDIASKGRYKIENLVSFINVMTDDDNRKEFISDVYSVSKPMYQLKLEEICKVKEWDFNREK